MTTHETLKKYFGYDTFRNGQQELVDAILAGRDTLGIMPTGAGKSICFQIPALMSSGVTIVVSPLISLMKDQVNALTQLGVAAAYINSSLTERQIDKALQNASNGLYKLIYIAPERLLTAEFLFFAQNAEISMLTVDEAHCISQWGQDFRPSYAKIPEFVENLPKRPLLSAFTATATPRVRSDIVNLLALNEPTVLVAGFDRPNLYFEVKRPKDKLAALSSFLEHRKEHSGIVYCSTRAAVEDVCEHLKLSGYNASRYHAGLSDKERHENQDDFLYDRVQIMVATNAFGMGIDKSNVSFVAHYNMPKDIESYYQEAGRAGRDGEPADCLLLYSGKDVRTNLWLIENSKDVEYSDKETEAALKERERKRLREITSYCKTNDCLRGCILRYFGETASENCENCGNCNADFELTDITVDAKKILSCVVRMKERYGSNMLIDTLRGSKNAKLLRFGLDKLSTYGISEKSESQLRDIINFLILSDYLSKTDGEYPVIRLGVRANEVLRDGAVVTMKLNHEEHATKAQAKKQTVLKNVDSQLLSQLRELRLAIANEQNVPAFVVFHDSTLIDMCMKTPVTRDELLDVSGVGQVKLERYGERFLGVIAEFVGKNGAGEGDLGTPKTFDGSTIEPSAEAVTVTMVADILNCALLESGYTKTTGQRINEWLVSQGYMENIEINGKNHRSPTEEGLNLGISTEECVIRGENVSVNKYNQDAQRLIFVHALGILGVK